MGGTPNTTKATCSVEIFLDFDGLIFNENCWGTEVEKMFENGWKNLMKHTIRIEHI